MLLYHPNADGELYSRSAECVNLKQFPFGLLAPGQTLALPAFLSFNLQLSRSRQCSQGNDQANRIPVESHKRVSPVGYVEGFDAGALLTDLKGCALPSGPNSFAGRSQFAQLMQSLYIAHRPSCEPRLPYTPPAARRTQAEIGCNVGSQQGVDQQSQRFTAECRLHPHLRPRSATGLLRLGGPHNIRSRATASRRR